MTRHDGVTFGVARTSFNVGVAVDVEVEMKNRPGIEDVFAGERSDDEVLAAGVALRLKIDPEDEGEAVDEDASESFQDRKCRSTVVTCLFPTHLSMLVQNLNFLT